MTAAREAPGGDGNRIHYGFEWRKPAQIVWLFLAGLTVLVLLTVTGLLPTALSYLWPAVYYTEISADVTAEGQRFQLKSVAQCRVYYKPRWGGLVEGSNNQVITGANLAKKLPSGAGLIIVGPALCSNSDLYGVIEVEKFNTPYEMRNINLQKYLDFGRAGGSSPKVLLLDDVQDTSVITAYWREAVTHPNADIQIHTLTYSRLRHAPLTQIDSLSIEAQWLNDRKPLHGAATEPHSGSLWIGFYMNVVGEDVWSKYMESKELIGRKSTTVVKIESGINLFKATPQNLFVDKKKKELIIEGGGKGLGYIIFQEFSRPDPRIYYTNYRLIVGDENINPPNVPFYDPYTKSIRVISKRILDLDSILE